MDNSQAVEFLKSKGLIEEGNTDFIIRYSDGRPQVSLPELLAEFVSYIFRDLETDADSKVVINDQGKTEIYQDGKKIGSQG